MRALRLLVAALIIRTTLSWSAPIAAWTFDEATPPGAHPAAGVQGPGIRLQGAHQLQVDIGARLREVKQLSLSAWVQPVSFDRYNEIFRQECPQRILFSFQEHGTLLSLGLHIGGYVECDAALDPKHVLDGRWHQVAATFDGEAMQVYLDGRMIGHLPRPGVPVFNRKARAYIGSSVGQGEFFQGRVDELVIEDEALSAAVIRDRYEAGIEAIEKQQEQLQTRVAAVYRPGNTFLETVTAIVDPALEPELVDLLHQKLQGDFPEAYGRYVKLAGDGPLTDSLGQVMRHRLALLIEYRPLTEDQQRRQTPETRAYWESMAPLIERCETWLNDRAGVVDQEGLNLVAELDAHLIPRPREHEAVAPYVVPSTPTTIPRSESEEFQLLCRDWLYQAGGTLTPQRLREELTRTRALARRLGVDSAQCTLDAFEQRFDPAHSGDTLEQAYIELRTYKRALMLDNPVVDFTDILLVDMPFPQGKEWQHETRHRLGYMAVPGARLLVRSGLQPGGSLRQLMPQPPLHGSIWRPDLSYDGHHVLFCYKPHNEKSFHLYEIGLDGAGLRQLTDGPYDDLDPIYLPDGEHILFSSTRGHTYVRCMPPTSAFVLARCDRDGKDIYLLSRNNEPDYLPSVLHDGRILYTRWEYTDKPLWRAQGLWTMHPDGTQVQTLWGNQSVWPDLLKDARSIPNSSRIMFTGSAHHNWFSGSVGLLDPGAGFNFPDGLTKVTAELPWPESGNGSTDPIESPHYHAAGQMTAYYSPYPLSEEDFLVSAQREGKFVLYLMDVHGNRELLHEGTHHILHAMPVRPRPRPPVLPDRVAWPTRESRGHPVGGTLYSHNVYEGAPVSLEGKVRHLRVFAMHPKTYTHWYKRPYLSTGPVVSGVQSEGVKELLGTVPVTPAGAVAFQVPSGRALHVQLLDEHFRALQTMRSFTGVMPGETRGCQGCHEQHSRAPSAAALRPDYIAHPAVITPPPWDDRTVSFSRYVRPVLDRYCLSCHADPGEENQAAPDLTVRRGHLGFEEVYWLFTGRPTWGRPYTSPTELPPGWGIADMLMVEAYHPRDPVAYRTPPPLTALSYRSRLIELAGSGSHYEVRVDPVSLRRLQVWIDAMCPYRGEEEIRALPDPVFQGVDWLPVRPRVQSAPRLVRPGPVD